MARKPKAEGQHHRACLVAKDGSIRFIDPNRYSDLFAAPANEYDYLMWHSWIGNQFMNAVMIALENNPMRVAWIGNCSATVVDGMFSAAQENGILPRDYGNGFIKSIDDFMPYFNALFEKYKGLGTEIIPILPNGGVITLDPSAEPSSEELLEQKNTLVAAMLEPNAISVVNYPFHDVNYESPKKPTYLVNNTKQIYIDLKRYFDNNAIGTLWGINDELTDVCCLHPLPLLTSTSNGCKNGDYFHHTGKEDIGSWAFDEIFFTTTDPSKLFMCCNYIDYSDTYKFTSEKLKN